MIFLHISNKQNCPFKWLYFSLYKRVESHKLLYVFGLSLWKSGLFTCHATSFTIQGIPPIFLVDKSCNCTFPQRFDEKKKLLTDHDAVLQTISEKLAECQQWQAQHKVQKPLQ